MKKCLSVLKGTAAVVLHFAHGGLLAVGVMVSVFVAMRVAEVGLTPKMVPALPGISLLGSAQAVSLEAGLSDLPATGSGNASMLTRQQQQIAEHVARKHRVARAALEQYIGDIYEASAQYKLDPLMLIALISVESAFNPTAESVWGAQGLTQVIPKYHPEKLAQFGPQATLLEPRVSIFVGAQVLHEYIRSAGSVEGGLQRYVGSIEDPDQVYSNKVLSEYRRLSAIFAPRPVIQTAQATL
ncbi:transglycosylase SLT domain-containing protein [Methyloversatilis thermotolerans]|uniref:transglycosylase SLT domain-containing protein n=1 Tax=Methyloversatilis thermotolerans TaxID=1346290 RepID=UPI0003A51664|nr:transglycosylase SLT domain-containing protein [Methyloversatilis thermotolerans]